MDLDTRVRKAIEEMRQMRGGDDPATAHGRADAILLSVLEAADLQGVAAEYRRAMGRVGFLYE